MRMVTDAAGHCHTEAFCSNACLSAMHRLCSVFQPILMPRKAGALRFVPFVGLAAFLIGGAASDSAVEDSTL